MEFGDSASSRAASKLRILKPARSAYINFVQSFRQSYKGVPKSTTEMVALAALTWRGMGERERAPYEAVAAQEKLKPRAPARRRRVDRLRSQVRLLKEKNAGLQSTMKRLQTQLRRRRALRQRVSKRAAPRGTQRRPLRKTGGSRRPPQPRRRPSRVSTSSDSS